MFYRPAACSALRCMTCLGLVLASYGSAGHGSAYSIFGIFECPAVSAGLLRHNAVMYLYLDGSFLSCVWYGQHCTFNTGQL